ncbi:MAG: hypothetical protein IKY03_03000 [Clostridia bacterium]|nr:hypothetical protein [Clostridia bacterium]
MLVRGMRWGYEGDDCAGGIGEGSTFAEIMVTDEKGRNWFVLVSKILEFERFYVAPVPLFDLEMHLFDYEVNYDYESAKIREALTEEYACREGVMPEAVRSSPFYSVIRLGRLAVRECEKLGEPDETGARTFISAYLGLSPDAEEIPDP